MKKLELEEAYRELQYRYNKLHSDTRIEIEKLKQENKVNLKNQQTDAEDKVIKYREKYGSELSEVEFKIF